jgi:hypothetical protein
MTYEALANFRFKLHFGRMSTGPKTPSMQAEKCDISREAAKA